MIQPTTPAGDDDNEVHLLDLAIIIGQHKMLVMGTPLLVGGLALGASLMMTPVFTSTAKIMPPQQQNSGMAAMLGSLGNVAGAAGGIAGLKTPSDLYVGLLESRSVADNLINRFKLKERYLTQTMDDTRSKLADASEFINGKKDGLISVSVNDKDAQFAADLANAYVYELTKLTKNLAFTEASQRRIFFETQLKDTKNKLADSEIALRTTQEKTGMIQPLAQVGAIISSVSQLKGTIAAKEVELNAMRTFATGRNPELLRIQEELRGMQIQLSKLEDNKAGQAGDSTVPTGKIPAVGVEYMRSARDVKYYETIYELVAKQYELAKIDEAKESSQIQLLDKAMPAERKSKPKRALITLAGLCGGLILGISLAFARAAYVAACRDPKNGNRWRQLSLAWRMRQQSIAR